MAAPRYPETSRRLHLPSWLGLAGGLALAAAATALSLARGGFYLGLFCTAAGICFAICFGSRRCLPYRFLFPALLTFVLFIIFPFLYTVAISLTNYGTGHVLRQSEVFELLLKETYFAPGGAEYQITFGHLQEKEGLLFTRPGSAQSYFISSAELVQAQGSPLTLLPIAAGEASRLFAAGDPARLLRITKELETATIVAGTQHLKIYNISRAVEARSRYLAGPEKDPSRRTLTRQPDQKLFSPDRQTGQYTAAGGAALTPGFIAFTALDNYTRLLNNKLIRGPFLRIFLWTLCWAVLATLLAFALGFVSALALDSPRIVGRKLFRVLIVIPYAIPVFLSALIWSGIFNESFGVLNAFLKQLALPAFPWLSNPYYAKLACLILGTWVGFPYMMLIILGILQSIDPALYEAATIDGAGSRQKFRHITLPAILGAVLPVLIGTFAFNFNNFGIIYLLNSGGPPMTGAQTIAGETDILISYTYKIAFAGGLGNDFGFAAAISILIFLMVSALSLVNFRLSGTLREVER